MNTIEINSRNGFLNIEDLPHNCIFNKKITGCGGTTVALTNGEKYVIAVPTTELIINKIGGTGDRDGIFGLYGTFDYQLKKSLKNFKGNKIMCTYDKVQYLDKYIDLSEWRLLVDEYHLMLKAYSYRDKAINGILQNFNRFKSYCFMSATPISPEFTPSALERTNVIEADWINGTDTMMVKPMQTNKPYVMAANIIKAYKKDGFIEINGEKSYEAFFFVNSVTEIANIIEHCDLEDTDYRVICADNANNQKKLNKKIENSRSEGRLITFITSKAFEGVDYFSETGACFVVSNTANKNTLLDISTDLFQIAGRIRTQSNPFRKVLFHIFNTQGKRSIELDITYDQLVARVKREVEITNDFINLANKYEGEDKKMAKDKLNNEYIYEEDGEIKLNDMAIKLTLYTYKVEQIIYKSGISIIKAYNKEGVVTSELTYERLDEDMKKTVKKESFEEEFKRYCNRGNFALDDDSYSKLCRDAYKLLGPDKVRSLRYGKKAVENAILNLDKDKDLNFKMAIALNKEIPVGFISNKDAKSLIKKIFETFGHNEAAKATLLDRWFNCKAVSKRIDGCVVKGYDIYSPKFILK